MAAQPVEAIIVWRYSKEAHNETYGRRVRPVGGFTKDYLQLSRRPAFKAMMDVLIPPVTADPEQLREVVYAWPGTEQPGHYDPESADRPHLKWDANQVPPVLKMTRLPTASTLATIPGDPAKTELRAAEREWDLIASRGGGQPYLVAVILQGDGNRIHLRAYLDGADPRFAFAELRTMTPPVVHELVDRMPKNKMSNYAQLDVAEEIRFDPDLFRGAWLTDAGKTIDDDASAPRDGEVDDDASAESMPFDAIEQAELSAQLSREKFAVSDLTANVKTRGSAQRAFASHVKTNYGYRCALTGISTPAFLVASHIVPWSADESIRLDPSNGICLSSLVDQAFETGHLLVEDDLTVRVDRARVGLDKALSDLLAPYDGRRLEEPTRQPPRPEYLQRRRHLSG